MTANRTEAFVTVEPAPKQPGPREDSRPRRSRLLRLWAERYTLIAIWLLTAAVFAVASPSAFLQIATLHAIFNSSAVYVLLGLAALCTAVVAEFDVSVPFVMGLSATIVPVLVTQDGMSTGLAVLIAMLAAALFGVINGFVVVILRVEPFVATLGTGTVGFGIAQGISHETPISGLSHGFAQFGLANILGLSSAFWYGIALAVFLTYLLAMTPLGRHMMFVGSNREVARLASVSVGRIRFGSYIAGAVIAGFAGIVLTAQLGGFDASSSEGYLLPVFATLFLSAAVVRPGNFNPVGIVIAGYFIATGTLGLELLGYDGWTQQVFYGGSLVIAVSVVSLVRRQAASTTAPKWRRTPVNESDPAVDEIKLDE
jgi:ribose transport system permease protein